MGTTVSMFLGIAFVGIGIAATIIQAWLWRFPMVPDPGGPDPNGRSTAPRRWTLGHRTLGLLFVIIYVVMMVEMVPRLWEYQVELPARTVIHACMGITIGFFLVMKIAIIRWFQHFGKALPMLGSSILLCTIILATLSVPYAVQAYDFGNSTSDASLARVERLLTGLEGLDDAPTELATVDAMDHGQAVLTKKCVVCHDMRTILKRPYTPKGWLRVVKRMLVKPQVGGRLTQSDVGPVTAYLVSITPDIQNSVQQKREADLAQAKREDGMKTVAPTTTAVDMVK
ncbi:MAG: mono/diheme cytochrome c family protein, partial [Myxococcota bacterium]